MISQVWHKTIALYQRRGIRLVLAIGTMLIVLGIMISILALNWSTLRDYPWQINGWALGATFISYSLGLVSVIYGWSLLMWRLTPVGHFGDHFRIYALTNLAKRIPGPLTHIAGRYVMYQEIGVEARYVTLGSAIEAVLLIIGAIISYFVAFSISSQGQYFGWWLVLCLIIGLLMVHPTVVTYLLKKTKNQTEIPALHYRELIVWLIFYILAWLLGGITVYSLINILVPLPLSRLPDIVAIWTLTGTISSLIFFSPSGLGVQEFSLIFMLGSYISQPVAVIVAILLRLMLMTYQIIWGGIVLVSQRLGLA